MCVMFVFLHLVADVCDVCIPSCICELGDGCFKKSTGLRRVTFCTPSSVECIGIESFSGTSLYEIAVPDTVRELRDRCFSGCETLKYVTFGSSSSLEVIGVESFRGTSIREVFPIVFVVFVSGAFMSVGI